ncbi:MULTISPECIES: L-2-amino-thiazoline-4-carboxylic acid hydrolase [Ramlibacter]|uniref:L-2-amino-thiazoline-4-carboxylic acid hydrolase n=1 Tax=Ramlibacter pinisoli TaxID=2682844 RepID=A0A6N8IY01_9BURK|nr:MULTISPECIES: L-2-amino-thiazoline-4-carboxylic acid hydrolase [Ramlibacter]MBA2961705.1 L-2-amino-thiazoline-4-carboxylic acid hydrolase [Ramlibacter sp. CGMCC 1.13660]MVQ31648.1 hypothetical protein [Ramlibacter pinisoli]
MTAPRLSFGDTSVTALVTAVRQALGPECPADWEQVASAVALRADELLAANRHMALDPPGEQWLRTCATVLAAYEELKPSVDPARLLRIFLNAMAAPFRQQVSAYLESRFGISDDAPQEAFSRISENFQTRGEQRFGASFRYATEVRDERRNFVNIQRCFFNDFFRANRAAEVTALFCALDKVWAEALEDPRYGVRFERPTTLAADGDACRFQFHRTGSMQHE